MALTPGSLIVSDKLRPEQKRRVFVEDAGPGWTTHQSRLGNMIMGITVELDTGERAYAVPSQVRPMIPEGTEPASNVVQFTPRARLRLLSAT